MPISESNTFWTIVEPIYPELKSVLRDVASEDKALRNMGRLLLCGQELGPKSWNHLMHRMDYLYGMSEEEVDYLLTLSMSRSLYSDHTLDSHREEVSYGK